MSKLRTILMLAAGAVLLAGCEHGDGATAVVPVASPVPPLLFCKADAQLDSWCRLTEGPDDHTFPSVSGNRVVWVDRLTPATRVIVMLDLTTGQTTRLTPDTLDTNVPTLDGDRVVYARLPANVGDWQLLTYDLKTGRESQFSSISRDVGLGRFSLNGNRVAWHTRRNNNWDVYVFDFSTNQETRITTDTAQQADPAIFGDRVAWSDKRQNSTWWDLYMYDLRTKVETRITQSTTLGRSPAISADRIVWGDIRGAFFSLYEYNFTGAGQEQKLNAGPVENSIVMAGSYVAWHDAGYDIAAFDIATGRQVQVTRLPTVQWLPTISQDYLAWEDYRNGNADVYIARLIDIFKP